MKLLTAAEAAEILRAPEATLRYWRHTGQGPRSVKTGRRILYRPEDLETWIQERYAAEAREASPK
jgi:excisionase family DNA binding protein